MLLGGIERTSFIDYPDKISCVLFLSGCNFKCPYCHNPDLVTGDSKQQIDVNRVFPWLNARQDFLDGVVISGGEPTLHDGLFVLCEKIKGLGYPIKLDTNGSNPEVLSGLVSAGLVDYIAMDIKTDTFDYSLFSVDPAEGFRVRESIQIVMEAARISYEFRTTCVKPIINEIMIDRIAQIINGAELYVLQRFHDTRVLDPSFFRGGNNCYKDNELKRLKDIAMPLVKRCFVR